MRYTRAGQLLLLTILVTWALGSSCTSCTDERDADGEQDMSVDMPLVDASSDNNNGSGSEDDGFRVCAEAEVDVSEAIPTVVLLIDRSSSMQDPFGDTTRWSAVYDALMDEEDGLVSSFEGTIRFGLALYTSDDGGPSCPELVQVAPKLLNRDDIDATYEPIPVPISGDTPTGDALLGVLPMFDGFEAEGPRVILLATDGEPDTCAEPNPQNGQDEAIAAAESAFMRGIKTFILSVGADVSQGHRED
ncbi:MAG: vWA domain-containing protein, partial [Myxococcota bacterium]